jgi:tripartite-type tricarboxylate transporter receptor subunit TctC
MTTTLVNEIEKIVRSDAFRSNLEPLGVTPKILSGARFAEFQRSELTKWGNAVRQSGAAIE